MFINEIFHEPPLLPKIINDKRVFMINVTKNIHLFLWI